jgi:RNA methyltransferase, TrmH family
MMAARMTRLSSRRHPLVSACRAIARGGGETADRMLLDGVHLVLDAVAAGITLHCAAFTPRALSTGEGARLADALSRRSVDIVEVTESVMEAMSPVSSPSGVVAIGVRPDRSLARTLEVAPQLVVAAVDVQEPGNVGAIVRAAEACGATGTAFCGVSADPFGWKALRGSMGSALRLPVATGLSVDATLRALTERGITIVATLPSGGERPETFDFRQPAALLFGGEGPGLPASALAAADCRVSIPMRAPVESLNVAVAVALLTYEAARQRGAL